MFDTVVKVLDVICPDWRDYLIGFATDEARNMRGRHVGLLTFLDNATGSNFIKGMTTLMFQQMVELSNLLQMFCRLVGGKVSLFQSELQAMAEAAGGLVTVFPETSAVEADFSRLRREKDIFKQSLSDFGLECVLHAQQHKVLLKITTKN
ncbi:hypothetical protein AXG93_3036s1350 [Marchantia polymorpha subsp. ruderalis]|uniref:Uncharacterized protein n=1 Tax=Marchantia polymorpha subsp. ruderalis TaxID=1480154 RepID=A0A176W7E9_MARPO|nr:hypothetical protein AXG93_3036s1350 [Marchantia polymorpha subsp. ruderalis]